MRVLLVEDDGSAAQFISKGLREASYAVDVARDGARASALCTDNEYDAIVLDVMLPKKDGLTVCRELRAAGADVPILMLTARDAVEARVEGLDAGADGYLTKPFDFRELLARLRALTRRDRRPVLPVQIRSAISPSTCRRGAPGREASRSRLRPVNSPCSSSSCAVPARWWVDRHRRARLGLAGRAVLNVVDVYVQRLRRKLDTAGEESCIRTRRGEGYQFLGTDL